MHTQEGIWKVQAVGCLSVAVPPFLDARAISPHKGAVDTAVRVRLDVPDELPRSWVSSFGEIVLDRANRHAACFVRRSLLQPGHRTPDTGHRTPDGHPPDTHLDSTPPESDSQFLCLCLSTAAVFALTGCFGVALTSSELGHRPIARLSSESLSMSSRGQFKRQSRSHSSLPSFFANGNHRTYSRKISVLVDFEIANIPKKKSTAYSKLWSVR